MIPSSILRFLVRRDDDFAVLGEFHGVTHEIDQDLPQPPHVAFQVEGNVRGDAPGEFDALLVRAEGESLQGLADGVLEGKVDQVEIELARFDLREIENIVDDA